MYSTLCINQCILGRNEAGQLGHGNVTRVDNPTEVSALDGLNIINVAIGKQHTLFVTGKKVFWVSPYTGLTKAGKVGDFFALVSMKSPNFCQKAKF